MILDRLKIWLKGNIARVDWTLLIFLLFFLNVKLVIKLMALLFMYIRRFNLSFRFSAKQPGIPFFYPAMVCIAIINFFIFSIYREHNYSIVFLTGIIFWIICLLVFHQLAILVEQSSLPKMHNALLLFFAVNAAFSFIQLFAIMFEIHEFNPYRYQGLYQKYFIGTGDYIKGVSFDTSTTNAILNSFGVLYFLSKKQMWMTLLCMIVLLLTCSNFTTALMVTCFCGLLVFRSTREQKSMIVVCLTFIVVFMTNISPQNNIYAINIAEKFFGQKATVKKKDPIVIPITQRPDSLLSTEEKKYKTAQLYLDSMSRLRSMAAALTKDAGNEPLLFKPEIPKANIHSAPYQHRPDSSEARMQAITFLHQLQNNADVNQPKDSLSIVAQPPGKIVAFQQIFNFMRSHPNRLLTGDGMGNFSSKLAFRATGLKIAGGYPAAYTYINEDFKKNHLSVYLDYFAKDSGFHSIAHSPNSFYGQLLSEYGLLGAGCFLAGYFFYFLRGSRQLTYGVPILFVLFGVLITDYWFEQLSVVIMFELFILLNKKEANKKEGIKHE